MAYKNVASGYTANNPNGELIVGVGNGNTALTVTIDPGDGGANYTADLHGAGRYALQRGDTITWTGTNRLAINDNPN